MTEELKQKAEEWCLNHTFADTDSAEGIRLQNAYIAGAEPREKRIADLEKKNAELKNRNAELKGMYAHSAREAGTYKQFFEQKEKENAELKEKSKRQSNNYKHDVDMLIEGNKYKNEVCKELAHQANVIQGQLTKAKEILQEFVKWATWQGSNCPNFKSIQDKAEQFLSEVEK